jgi:putative transposase
MARPLRIEYEDAFYHVMNRGRGRQNVFPGESYCQDFLQCIDGASQRFGVEVHAYCLMGNHYHLLIKTPRGNLSRAMRHIDGVYTQRHNRRKRTDGSLFRGRYKSIVVDGDSYLLQVSRYIHRNPVEMKKPLVTRLEDYPWSSYPAYINQEKALDWLNRDTIFGEIGRSRKYKAYKNFVERGNDSATVNFYQKKHTSSIWGDKKFKTEAHKKARCLDSEVDKRGLKQPVPLLQIVDAVASYYDLSASELCKTKRGRGVKNIPRWVAMKLCQDVGGAKLAEIAKVFQVGHYSTVSQTIGRLNRLASEDRELEKEFNVLSQDLTP